MSPVRDARAVRVCRAVRDGQRIYGSSLRYPGGAQFGRTDYDVFEDGGAPAIQQLIRVDCDPLQVTGGRLPDLAIIADASQAVAALLAEIEGHQNAAAGAQQAADLRAAAFSALDADYQAHIGLIDTILREVPGCRIVGDSTQVVYAGNMYADIPAPRGWFNASTGYGALGYGAPAAIGAALGDPATPVVCITGDGGLQFCLSELGTAMDERTPVIFVVWNNDGYREIETFMVNNGIKSEGVNPSAPDFVAVAKAYGMSGERLDGSADLAGALRRARAAGAACLIEVVVP